jgi:hypothetical protein
MVSLGEIIRDVSAAKQSSSPLLGSLRNIAKSEGLSSQPSISELFASVGGLTDSLRVALSVSYIPQYNPLPWNDFGTLGTNGIQFRNNCYNYACNIANNTFAQPGSASGNPYTALNCPSVGAGVQSDGLIFSSDFLFGCLGINFSNRVALVIWPGEDFHFYRQDRSGMWSHKPGSTEATNRDNSGNLMADPQTANRGPYTVFCGYYCARRELVTIGKPPAIAASISPDSEGISEGISGSSLSSPEESLLLNQSSNSIVVRLLIFSGRPDPEWTISTEEWTALLTQARRNSDRARVQAAPTGGLGYRGFEVYSPTARADLPRVVAINRGVVTERSETQALSWQDVSSLEQQLLDQARQQGYGNLLDSLGLPE